MGFRNYASNFLKEIKFFSGFSVSSVWGWEIRRPFLARFLKFYATCASKRGRISLLQMELIPFQYTWYLLSFRLTLSRPFISWFGDASGFGSYTCFLGNSIFLVELFLIIFGGDGYGINLFLPHAWKHLSKVLSRPIL